VANTKRLGLLVVLAVLVVGGAISGCAQQQTSTTPQTADITGAWHGTYKSARGSGEWAWVIKKSGNEYTGILTTTGPYSGQDIPVSVTLEGNKITVGWVAAGVVFEGTVSGDKMSGTWKFQNGMDSGSWEGVRGESSITPHETSASETETPAQTPQSGNPYDTAKEVQPSGETATKLNDFIKPKLVNVFGGAKLVFTGTITGTQLSVKEATELDYVVKRKITAEDVNTLKALIEMEGYTTAASGVTSGEFTIIFLKNHQPVLALTGDVDDQNIVVGGVIE